MSVAWVASDRLAAKAGCAAVLALGLGACSATDPMPSPSYDGRYVGTRLSRPVEACGISQPQAATSARVAHGRLTLPLFGPKTELTGTVGDDGRVRASGIWPNPTRGFPGMTVLNGQITDNELDATASDFRCRTDLRLRKVVPSAAGARQRRLP